ncbi:hypothetical protein V8E53_004243 [Lactarius tabidus]
MTSFLAWKLRWVVLSLMEGEDAVGALFVETIPLMVPQYMLYTTRHPAALVHLGSLPQNPDLPSLLIKPIQRFLKYALLLHAIIEETPDSHSDRETLLCAKTMVEDVLRAINEGQRRREIVNEVFAAGKPVEVLKKKCLGIMGRVRAGVGVSAPMSISRADSEEEMQIAQMERDISRTDSFIHQMVKETVKWVRYVQALMSALRVWAEGFGRVIDVTSEAFDAFSIVVDNPKKITPRSRQVRATTSPPSPTTVRGAVNVMHSLEPERTGPADTMTFPKLIPSARRKRGSNASATALAHWQPKASARTSIELVLGVLYLATPHPGHASHRHPHPPVPPAQQLTVSSRWYRAPALLSCRVIHECDPPEGVQYYGIRLFRLSLDDVYRVLKEAGHPSRHRDLPLLVDENEDCLLLARDNAGELGWLLASFLFPVD